jgi:hypothetical protein
MADVASPGTAPQSWQGLHPPGPKGLPMIGHLLDIRRDPLGFFSACCQQYGNIVSLRFGTWPALLLSGPSDLETVLVKAADRFKKNTFFWRQHHRRAAAEATDPGFLVHTDGSSS